MRKRQLTRATMPPTGYHLHRMTNMRTLGVTSVITKIPRSKRRALDQRTTSYSGQPSLLLRASRAKYLRPSSGRSGRGPCRMQPFATPGLRAMVTTRITGPALQLTARSVVVLATLPYSARSPLIPFHPHWGASLVSQA